MRNYLVRMGLIFDTDPALVLVDCCDIIPQCRLCLKAIEPGFKHVFRGMADRLPTGLWKEPRRSLMATLSFSRIPFLPSTLCSSRQYQILYLGFSATERLPIVICTASSACCMVQATMTLRTAFLVSIVPEGRV